MALDLNGPKEVVEELILVDDAVIFWDEEGVKDDILDPETGELIPVESDEDPIWEGKCSIRALTPSDAGLAQEAGVEIGPRSYKASVPLDEFPYVQIGSVLKVTHSVRDPLLAGRTFTVRGLVFGTTILTRKLVLEKRL